MSSILSQTTVKLDQKQSLNSDEMTESMEFIVSGHAADDEMEGFLLALRKKGETVEEIVAAAKVMRGHSIRLTRDIPDLLDTCGTGGDGLNTLNISTLSAIVACAAGIRVAKHGNRSISSISGSADILESLGVKIDLSVEQLEASLEKTGFAFFFAPKFHPAMRFASAARKKIQGKTIFNILGPLSNPAGVSYQVIGVYERRLVAIVAKALFSLGLKKALVVHGLEGVDEISVSSQTFATELLDGRLIDVEITPEACGILRAPVEYLRCQSKEEALELALQVLKGKKGAALDAICLNAAAALYVAGKAASLKDGVNRSRILLESGAVYKKLEEIILFSKNAGN